MGLFEHKKLVFTPTYKYVNINAFLTLDPGACIHTSEEHKCHETDAFD